MKKFFILMLSVSLMYGCSRGDEDGVTNDTTIIDDGGGNDNQEPYKYTYEDLLNREWRIADMFITFEDQSYERRRINVYSDMINCLMDTRLNFDANGNAIYSVYEEHWAPNSYGCHYQPLGSRFLEDEKILITKTNQTADGITFTLSNGATAIIDPNSFKDSSVDHQHISYPDVSVIIFSLIYYPQNLNLDPWGDSGHYESGIVRKKVSKVETRFIFIKHIY